ncbi:RNA polymerase III RPC4-domain-containing protein [Xylariomycetidae sp. FL2044]|nr:RNA polymerase III RPC4-domain-containing protein [Xylariomycetidae sp. FL2044]
MAPPRGSRGGARGRPRGSRGGRGAATTSSTATASRVTEEDVATPSVETGSGSQVEPPSQDAPSPHNPARPQSASRAPSSAAGAGERSSQTPSATSRGASRFKPKNIRRDAAERQKLEDARNRDLASKIKAEERELRAAERRNRRGRGRAGFEQRGLIRRNVTAMGPFSAIAAENVRPGFGAWGGAGKASSSKKGGDSYSNIRYQPRRDREERINIDLLNGQTDGYDENGSELYQPSRYAQSPVGNIPIGLVRTQHEEAEVKVKTTKELEAEEQQISDDDDEDLFVDGAKYPGPDGLQHDTEIWPDAPKDHVRVKAEPGTEPDSMDLDMSDIPEVQIKAPPSPELKKKPVVAGDDTSALARKRRKEKASKDLEVQQSAFELDVLMQYLNINKPGEGQETQSKDDILFLFQLPPILPPLINPSAGTDGTDPIDLTSKDTQDGKKVKTEDGAEPQTSSTSSLPPEGGYVGKLNVRKSGKVEFDWGGTPLNLGLGANAEFFTSALMVEQHENLEDPAASTGFACGMGEIAGKFVLTPVWDEEEEWDPNLDELDLAV